jgi:DNA polymerase III subunit alpha
VFARYTPVLNEDKPVLITGEVEAGENVVKVRAQDIVSLETVKQRSVRSIVIHINRQGLSRASLIQLRDLIFRHPGECQLKFQVDLDGGKKAMVAIHNRYSIMPDESLLEEIESLVNAKVIRET